VAEWRQAVGAPEECPYGITLHTIPPFDRAAYMRHRQQQSQPAQQPQPSLLQKAANFAAAAAQHVAAGAPMASQAEVQRRHDICTACPHFDGKACGLCGCPVARERKWLSKLSWADQKCPDDPPRWGAVEG
jgi:hypothetical protein